MQLDVDTAISVLERTPATLRAMLEGLPAELERGNEGEESWSPHDIVGHLIHGEHTDWVPRLRIVLEHGEARAFEPFDRFAQFERSLGKTLGDLLDEFGSARAGSLKALRELQLRPSDLDRTGRHPELGVVTLGELLSTWVVHDLGHIAQIARVMAAQLAEEVGPWKAYLPVLGRGDSR